MLNLTQELASKIINTATTGIYIYDFTQQSNTFINDYYTDLLGYTLDEINSFGDGFMNLFHEDDRDSVLEHMGEVASGQERVEIEYRFKHKDGHWIWCYSVDSPFQKNEDGDVISFIGSFTDTTQRKQAEEERKKSDEKYHAVVDALEEGVVFQLADGSIQACNRSAEKILGLTRDQMIGRTSMDPRWRTIHEDGSPFPGENHPMVHTLKTGEPTSNVIMGIHQPNGSLRWISVSCSPLFNEGESLPYGAVGSMFDITERKELESQLRQSEKMKAIGQLAGGVAHDFNNQLASIMGYTGLLEIQMDDPELIEYLQKIIVAVKNAKNLIGQLLTFSRKQELKLETVNIHELIKETVELLSHSIDKRIEIRMALASHQHLIEGDKTLIQNALLNLGLNARDAMSDKGRITITTKFLDLFDGVCFGDEFQIKPGKFIQIDFEDTGCGISKENIQKVFQPFFTTKESGAGTGMGLASVYGAIQQHKGAIAVESEVNEGTRFRVWLPLSETITDEVQSKGHLPVEGGNKKTKAKSILIADDEELLRDLYNDFLTALGHEPIFAVNGLEAVNLYRDRWQDIDLVILDMMMPEMTGNEVFIELKKINPSVKVVISTGYTDDNSIADIEGEGVLGTLWKPFELYELQDFLN